MLHSHHIIAAQNSDFGFINIGDMTEDRFALCGKKIQVKQHCRYLTVARMFCSRIFARWLFTWSAGSTPCLEKSTQMFLNEVHGCWHGRKWSKRNYFNRYFGLRAPLVCWCAAGDGNHQQLSGETGAAVAVVPVSWDTAHTRASNEPSRSLKLYNHREGPY